VQRPRVFARPTTLLDLAIVACLAVVALELVPLAPEWRERVAPGAVLFDRMVGFQAGLPPTVVGNRPASIYAGATQFALLVGVIVALVFWNARAVFARGGLRIATRGMAWLGVILAPLSIVTHSTSPRLLYGYWQPYAASARPYGPFVNRNDLACWLVMALPLTIGYIAARAESRRQQATTFASTLDATMLWLWGSVVLMSAALLATLSRAGFASMAVALVCLAALSLMRRSLTPRRAAALVLVPLLLLTVAALYVNLGELAEKLGALSDGVSRRQTVWRFTWQMVRDFWPAGVGLGAYQHGILLYAQPFPYFYVNHAHNQYLQFLVEGGLFLLVPAVVAILAGGWLIMRRLAGDRTPVFWIRAGAASGIAGFLVHSLWENTLRMPANAVLFALLAAVAMHDGGSGSRESTRRST
jgi:hypothetical protein